jgi:hypothetical protein
VPGEGSDQKRTALDERDSAGGFRSGAEVKVRFHHTTAVRDAPFSAI